jgi:hypothetical protein
MAVNNKIRVGIAGVSPNRRFASIAHIPALQALPEFEISAVCTTRQDSADAAAKHYGVRLAFCDAEKLAHHPDVDLVAVSVKVPAVRSTPFRATRFIASRPPELRRGSSVCGRCLPLPVLDGVPPPKRGKYVPASRARSREKAVPLLRGTERCYGAGGEEMAPSSLREPMECPDAQPNDWSRSLVALDQDGTIVAVVGMSQSSWLVAGMLPGIERQPRKKLEPSAKRLLGLLLRWRDEAVKA